MIIQQKKIPVSSKLPKEKWKDDTGEIYKGGRTISIDVPLNCLPYFERLK
jgi:alpha-glucosidase